MMSVLVLHGLGGRYNRNCVIAVVNWRAHQDMRLGPADHESVKNDRLGLEIRRIVTGFSGRIAPKHRNPIEYRTLRRPQARNARSKSEKSHRRVLRLPASHAIARLKRELISKGEATELFGQLRGEGLASSIATIEQGFGDELFYPNVASRAAHLLYFVVKNHPLADGNKRTGCGICV